MFIGALESGGVEGTNGEEIFDIRHLRSNYIEADENLKYEIYIESRYKNLITSVLMYDENDKYLGVAYASDEMGYIFTTLPNTKKIRLSLNDPTLDREPLFVENILSLKLRTYERVGTDEPTYTDGYYVRIKRDSETRSYFKKIYDRELYQPVKIYEINGIYELKGYR